VNAATNGGMLGSILIGFAGKDVLIGGSTGHPAGR
jgi:hypothetical protein